MFRTNVLQDLFCVSLHNQSVFHPELRILNRGFEQAIKWLEINKFSAFPTSSQILIPCYSGFFVFCCVFVLVVAFVWFFVCFLIFSAFHEIVRNYVIKLSMVAHANKLSTGEA